jgi:glucose-1-phosphate thymidylyltransferase
VAEKVINGRPCALILGDNFIFGTGLPRILVNAGRISDGATIFGYPVAEPSAFGIAVLDEQGRVLELEEKPAQPKSNLAVPGVYFYDGEASAIARSLRPSARGELEITALNMVYLRRDALQLIQLGRGIAWLDGGTPEDLYEASQFVHVMEKRTGLKVGCPEEIAFRKGFISITELEGLANEMKSCSYRCYLLRLVAEGWDHLHTDADSTALLTGLEGGGAAGGNAKLVHI